MHFLIPSLLGGGGEVEQALFDPIPPGRGLGGSALSKHSQSELGKKRLYLKFEI